MRNFRSIIDISPWDSTGSSFWGLRRGNAKRLGLLFIITAILLADPPFSAIPNDFINLFLANFLMKITSLSFEMAIVLTYTLIPLTLFAVGIYIYPYNTQSLLNGYISKAKKFFKKQMKNPIMILIGITMFIIVFKIYKSWLL